MRPVLFTAKSQTKWSHHRDADRDKDRMDWDGQSFGGLF